MLKDLMKNKSDKKLVDKYTDLSLSFLNELKEKYPDLEIFLQEEKNILDVRRKSLSFVKEYISSLDKWTVRDLSDKIFSRLNIDMEKDSSEKFIFLLFTDAISEVKPEAVPLVFFYNGYPIVKKHGIVIDFNILPFMIQTVEEISPEKKHQLVLSIYSEEELVLKGISKYLSEINFLILNLLDKVLYKEIVPFDKVVVKQGHHLQPDKEIIKLIIRGIFSGLVEFFLNQKENLSGILSKEKTAYFTKIKNYIKGEIQDRDELTYLKETAKIDEESIENRILAIRDYENQKNVFEESLKREDIPIPEKIESVFWLLGVENINPVLLVRYYDTDDIIYFIHDLLKQSQDEGFLSERLKDSVKHFLYKIFQYPYLSKGYLNKKTLDKPIRLLFKDDYLLEANYLFYTRRYEEFLEKEKSVTDKTPELRLKQLLARYYLKQFSKEELTGWLSLENSKEGQFFYYLFTGNLDNLPTDNEYRYIADLYTVKASPDDIIERIGEEGMYTLLLRLLGFYPYDKTLLNLADVRFML